MTPPNAAIRVGLFAVILVALFGGAFAIGATLDPDAGDGDATAHGEGATHGDRAAGAQRIVLEQRRFGPGVRATLAFRIVDREGRTVEDFDVEHQRAMHVIVARHDLTGYQHLHPRRTADGGWGVEVEFPDAGPHRVYADFATAGAPRTLSADVQVAGRYSARPLPPPAVTADAGGGYRAAIASDGAERRFTVTRDGRPVEDIEPYLGARGHLVALREGSLAFQHVHPKDRATEGRRIAFDVVLARAGSYGLFLQFKHDGAVHTAAFTEQADVSGHGEGEDDHGH